MNKESKAKQITVEAKFATGKPWTKFKLRAGTTTEQAETWALDTLGSEAVGWRVRER